MPELKGEKEAIGLTLIFAVFPNGIFETRNSRTVLELLI